MQLFFIPQAPAAPSSTPLDVYLSSANGNDANNGLTPTTAVATFSRVWELLPTFQTQPFVVHIDGGGAATLVTDYAYTPPPKNVQIGVNAFIVLYGDGAGQSTNDGFYEVLTGRTATGASTVTQLVDTAGGLAVNAYKGFVLEVLDGPAAGHRKTIVENTVDTIYPVASFCTGDGSAAAPANGNAYRIVRPNVRLAGVGTLALAGTNIHFVNIRTPDYSGTEEPLAVIQNNAAFLFGIETGNVPLCAENGALFAGTAASSTPLFMRPQWVQTMYPLLLAALGDPSTLASGTWNGWGIGISTPSVYAGVNATTDYGAGLDFHGYIVSGRIVLIGSKSQATVYGFGLQNLIVEDGGSIFLDTLSFDYSNTRCLLGPVVARAGTIVAGDYNITPITITASGVTPAIFLTAGSTFLSYGDLTVTHSGTGKQLHIERDSSLILGDSTYTGATRLVTSGATSSIGTIDGGVLMLSDAAGNVNSLSGATGLTVKGRGSVSFGTVTTLAVTSGAAVTQSEGSQVDMRANLTLTGTVTSGTNQDAVLSLGGAGTSFNQTAGTLTVSNTNVGANANGVYVGRGASASLLGGASTAVTTAGAVDSYGAVAMGAGSSINFVSQPTGVVGNGAGNDLLVDAAAHPDTDLAVSLSSVTSTSGARISRAA